MSRYAGMTLDEAVDHAVGLADPGTHAGREHAAIGAWLIELRRLRMVAEERSRLLDRQFSERDRLRDIVRRMLDAIDALYTVAAPGAIVKELTPDRTCLGVPIGQVVAEARAAIGEG